MKLKLWINSTYMLEVAVPSLHV